MKRYAEDVEKNPRISTYVRIAFISGVLLGVAVTAGIVAYSIL